MHILLPEKKRAKIVLFLKSVSQFFIIQKIFHTFKVYTYQNRYF